MPDPEPPGPAEPGLRAVGSFLLQESLRNSVRLLILLSLGINRHLSFSELLELTGTSKGSLSHHLDQLASAGYLESRMVFTLGGPRVRVEITPKGLATYEDLTQALGRLAATRNPPDAGPSSTAGLSRG
ncbi:MAG TPA: transcriptional regulator [Thermoplasmata archaeon]|jgi:DNA-binding MarR family transcriptional regulator|nr:transcriptional regulator [Thermoplasmata archaeon]